MAEESAVNYWEVSLIYQCLPSVYNQSSISLFVPRNMATWLLTQHRKTSCVLRYKPAHHKNPAFVPSSAASASAGSSSKDENVKEEEVDGDDLSMEEGFVSCCFSFTIRRDKWGIPSMIVGNFIRC